MKSKKNEELKSRRDFFKKAAKSALPILGAVVLTNFPLASNAVETMGCPGSCYTSCVTTCGGGCRVGCTSCRGGCAGACKGYCYSSCS